MAYQQKEKFEGHFTPTGEHKSFNRQWGGHRFTDEQCEQLLAGEQIDITDELAALGKTYKAYGKLEDQEREITDDATGEPKTIRWFGFRNAAFDPEIDDEGNAMAPDHFIGHDFTAAEREKLSSGGKVYVTDFFSKKKQKQFAATASWTKDGGFDLDFGN